MMFLLRSAFWLLILVLLIPTDKEQQNQIYGTAQAALNDIAGFCNRNPQTCAKGQDAFAVLVQKAQYGAEMIMALVEDGASDKNPGHNQPQSAAAPADNSVMPVPSAVPLEMLDPDGSQDTLSPEDRQAAWGGSGV